MIHPENISNHERLAHPLSKHSRMSCMNAIQLIEYFINKQGADIAELLQGLSVDEEYIRNTANRLNNYDTYLLYYNCQHSVSGFTHKDWFYVGQDVYTTNAPGYFKALLKLFPLSTIYKKIPEFNRKTSDVSEYKIIETHPEFTAYSFKIKNSGIQRYFSIGGETYYHLGILSALPRLQIKVAPFADTKQPFCSMEISHILNNCYNIDAEEQRYSDEGFYLNDIIIARWIRLSDINKSTNFEYAERSSANALIIEKDVIVKGLSIFTAGEIYNAPFTKFEINYENPRFFKRIIGRSTISVSYLEKQLELTQLKYREAEKYKQKARQLEYENKKLKNLLKKYENISEHINH